MTTIGHQIDCGDPLKEFAGFPQHGTPMPLKGAYKLFAGANAPSPGLYWLGSRARMQDNLFPDGELVHLVRRRSGYVYFEEPLCRTYHGPGLLVKAPILTDQVFKDGSGPLSLCLIYGLEVRNWEIDGYDSLRGISIQGCKYVQVQECSVSHPTRTGPGEGYGIQLQRVVSANVWGVKGASNRHLTTAFASADGTFRECVATSSAGDGIDFGHGYGEEDLTYENCDSGDTNAAVGNKYLWGSHRIRIVNHRNCKDLLCYGNTSTVIEGGQFTGALRFYANQAGKQMSAQVTNWPFAKGFRAENEPEYEMLVKTLKPFVAGG